jgi:HD-like signal output (HDOD) protein
VQKILLLSETDSSPREFADLIAMDHGLTAKVLRLVNSAFYSLRTPISSIRQASSLLGTKTLKSLALSISVMRLFGRGCEGLDRKAFWRHSQAVALCAQKLSALLLPAMEEELYVSGLLHDVGVALLVHYLPGDYSLAMRMARSSKSTLCEVEIGMFGLTHAEVGYTIATRWRLPATVCDCIRHHERPSGSFRSTSVETARAVDVIRFCDAWCHQAGLDFLTPGMETNSKELTSPSWLSLSAEQLSHALSGVEQAVAEREQRLFPADPGPAQESGAPANASEAIVT